MLNSKNKLDLVSHEGIQMRNIYASQLLSQSDAFQNISAQNVTRSFYDLNILFLVEIDLLLSLS